MWMVTPYANIFVAALFRVNLGSDRRSRLGLRNCGIIVLPQMQVLLGTTALSR